MRLGDFVQIYEPNQLDLGGGAYKNEFVPIKLVRAHIKQKTSLYNVNQGAMSEVQIYFITIRKPLMIDRGLGEIETRPTTTLKLKFWEREFRIIGIEEDGRHYYKITAVEVL